METDEEMHDGSPLGNGHVNARVHLSLAICPYQECSSRGWHWKCYLPCHDSCVTYRNHLLKKATENPKPRSDSRLVDVVLE